MYYPSLRKDKNIVFFSANKPIIDQIYKLRITDNNKREYIKIFELDEALYRRIREINVNSGLNYGAPPHY